MRVQETAEDLERLQALLDASVARAGAFLRASFEMPRHSLSATALVCRLEGLVTVAFATTTARGEPRVAPVGALFYRGSFYVPSVNAAARTRHARARAAVSLTYFAGNDVAIIAHGTADVIDADHSDFAALEALHRALAGTSVRAWGEGVFLRVTPEVLYTYAREPAG